MSRLLRSVFLGRWLRVQGGDVSILPLLILLAVAIAISYFENTRSAREATVLGPVFFSSCSGQARINCVVDGDTIWAEGEKVRLADIDAPEIFSPQCTREEELGHRATQRLTALLNQGPVKLEKSSSRERDKYGRLLRVATVNGRSVGQTLVGEGLAHRWGAHRQGWC